MCQDCQHPCGHATCCTHWDHATTAPDVWRARQLHTMVAVVELHSSHVADPKPHHAGRTSLTHAFARAFHQRVPRQMTALVVVVVAVLAHSAHSRCDSDHTRYPYVVYELRMRREHSHTNTTRQHDGLAHQFRAAVAAASMDQRTKWRHQ